VRNLHEHGTPAERVSMSQPLILNRYRLIERIASGGSAEVWRARDEQLGRDVAVKLLHSHLLPDRVSRARLVAEARAAAALNHPAIVAVYDVDPDGEPPALVTEYVAGGSLATRLAEAGPMPPEDVARIGADIADALYLAHRLGVVHRDLKPGNILLEPDGRARLADFGIAHSLAPDAERLTITGAVVGTLRSMAPEQLLGGTITPRTDLYGLGTVLYEALVGWPPYAETSPVALANAQETGPPPLVGVPLPLATIVTACLQPDPARRPIHAGAVAAALRAWLAGNEAAALGIAPRVDDVDTGAPTQVRPAVAAVADGAGWPRRPANRFRGPLIWVGAVAVASLLAATLLAPGIVGPGASTTASASATATAVTATPTVAPTPFNIEDLDRPVADEVRKWWEDCGTDGQAPPFDVSQMSKREVEDAFKPLRDACKEEED
jgi:eukaryotic-like serine/threonine-protein kinase